MIYRRLILSCSVVQNCQVDVCQAVDGVAVRIFTAQRSVQIRLGQFNHYQLTVLRDLDLSFTAFIKLAALLNNNTLLRRRE